MHPIVKRWIEAGRPEDKHGVPHEVKSWVVEQYGSMYGLDTLVETGTCHGHLILDNVNNFSDIHTIEMSEELFAVAKKNLESYPWVHQYLGDSGKLLFEVINSLRKPALFFLDAHYSGDGTARGEIDTPVGQELVALSQSPYPNVIIIDDARLFRGEPFHTPDFKDYPDLAWIEAFVEKNFVVESCVIREADEFVVVPV